MNLEELKIAKARAVEAARADITNDEVYNKAMDEVANIDKQIERIENLRKIGESAPEAKAPAKDEQRSMFAKALTGNFADMVAYKNAYTLGTAATAGALTAPMEFVEELIKGVDDITFMRQIAHVTPKLGAAQSLGFPYRTAKADDADWLTEIADEASNAESTLAYGRREFKPIRMAKLITVSKALINHSNIAEQVIKDEMASAIARTLEKAYISGTGSNQPLGVFTASANGVSTARDVAGTLTADSLIDMKYALKGQYHGRASWVMHRDIVKAVAKLKDANNQYIWQPGLANGAPDTLLGMPVHMSEFAPNTTTTGSYVAVLGDFSNYWICDADSIEMQVLAEKYALTGQVGYLFNYYGDGAPVVEEAFARLKV